MFKKPFIFLVLLSSFYLFFEEHGVSATFPTIELTEVERQWIEQNPVIKVSNEMDWPPFDFVENGKPSGFSIDLMNLVAKRLGLTFKYVNGMSWSELLVAFKAKEIDLMSAINFADSRTSYAQFTDAYFDNAIGLFSREDLNIHSLSDLTGKTVALPNEYAVLEELKKEVDQFRHHATKDMISAIKAVATGEADYTIESASMVQYLINQHGVPNIRLSFFPEFEEYKKKYIGLRAATHVDNPILGQIVQKALKSITFEERQALRQKWLGSSYQEHLKEVPLTQLERDWIKNNRVIRVANEMDWRPLDYFEDGTPKGYSIEYVQMLASKVGLQLEFVNGFNWAELIDQFKQKKIDVMPVFNQTQEREGFTLFTTPYQNSVQGLYVNQSNSQIKSIDDLKGRLSVGVPLGDPSAKLLPKAYPNLKLLEFEDTKDLFIALATNEIEALVVDPYVFFYFQNLLGLYNLRLVDFVESEEISLSSALYIGVRKDFPILHSILQKAIDSVTNYEKSKLDYRWLGKLSVQQEHQPKIWLTSQEKAWLQKHPVLRVSNETDYPPFDFVQNGQPAGYNIDLLNELAQRIGIKIEYVNGYSWHELVEMFKKGQLDLMHALKVTAERNKYGLFSIAYRRLKTFYAVSKDDGNIESLRQLYGKRIAVGKGWYQEEFLKKHHPQIERVLVNNLLEMLEAVADGHADVTVGNRDVLEYFIKKHGLNDIKIDQWAHEIDGGQAYTHHFMAQKNAPELISMLNKALESLTVEELDNLNRKWFGLSTNQKARRKPLTLTPAEQTYLQQKKTLKKCSLTSYVPMEWIDDNGQHQGIARTLSDKISEIIDIPIELHPTNTWQESLDAGKERKCDMFTAMLETPERRKFLDFTDTFIRVPMVIVTHIRTPFFEDTEELSGKKIGVVRVSAYNEILSNMYPELEWKEVETISEGLDKVQKEELYGFVDSLTSVGYRIQRDSLFNLKIAGKLDHDAETKVGVRNDEPLLFQIMQKAVNELDEQEKRDIVNQWITVKYEKGIDYELIWQILIVVLLIIVGSIYWNRRLASANQKSRQLNEQLAEIQRIASLGSWEFNLSTKKITWSKEGLRIVGIEGSKGPSTLDEYSEFIHADDRMKLLKSVEDAINGNSYELELRHIKPDGTYNYTLTRAKPLKQNEVVTVIQGTVLDLTRLRQTELALKEEVAQRLSFAESLRASEERFRSIVEASTDWIWEIDAKGFYTFASEHVEQTLGFKPEEIIGKTPFDLMTGDEAKKVQQEFEKITENKLPFRDLINVTRHKDGGKVVLNTSGNPIFSEEGTLLGYRGVDRDVTGQVEFQSNLEKAKQEAEKANQAKSAFLANMSHEMRTPMNAILGLSHLSLQTTLNDQQRAYQNKIQYAAESLLRLINDILDFSKIEAGMLELVETDFNLKYLLDGVRSLITVEGLEKGLRYHSTIENRVPQNLIGDAMRLEQILLNLTSNAIKFTSKGDVSVHVTLVEESNKTVILQFSVSDTGIGMSQNQVDQLFRPFHQADLSITRKFGGTGLGLAICKRLIDLMGGKIWVDSDLDKGSRFCFEIQFEKSSIDILDNHLDFSIPKIKHALGNKNVLIVEDNETNLQVAKELLEQVGLDVSVAINGIEAVESVQQQRFDLVLMDLQMPELDGLSATEMIRKLHGQSVLPIVAMTANAMEKDKKECLEIGMNDHVAKPIKPRSLYETVIRWMLPGIKIDSFLEQKIVSEAVHQNLPELPGIDIETGLVSVNGSWQMYTSMLRDMIECQIHISQNIREALNSGNGKTAHRLIHTFKSIAGSIGALKLSEIAQELESALNEDKLRDLTGLINEFDAECTIVMEGIKEYYSQEPVDNSVLVQKENSPVQTTRFDLGKVQNLFEKLNQLLNEQDVEAGQVVANLKKELEQTDRAKEIHLLEEQINGFRFDEARNLCEQLLNQCFRTK